MSFSLVGAGCVSGSFVARLPRLTFELGPVAAQSFRLASRIVNSIGAGRPVKGYQDLARHKTILLCIPARSLPAIVGALSTSLPWRGKTALLCGGGGDSRHLQPLRALGASTGSMHLIAGLDDGTRFVVEGAPAAVREARRLTRQLGARMEEVHTIHLDAYSAGLAFGTTLFTPLLEASVQSLVASGLKKANAIKISEALFQRSLRAYMHAGRRSWNGPLADGDGEAVLRGLDALCTSRPLLARYYRDASAFALELFGDNPSLVDTLRAK